MVDRGGGAMAAPARFAATARRGVGSRAEGTGAMRAPRRARCAGGLRERGTGASGSHDGAARRRPPNSGELVRAAERGREEEKGTGAILTLLRSSGTGFSSVRRVGATDRRRWLELPGAAMAAAWRG